MKGNEDLVGSVGEDLDDEEVKQKLLSLGEDRHKEKRDAVASFNNKVCNCKLCSAKVLFLQLWQPARVFAISIVDREL